MLSNVLASGVRADDDQEGRWILADGVDLEVVRSAKVGPVLRPPVAMAVLGRHDPDGIRILLGQKDGSLKALDASGAVIDIGRVIFPGTATTKKLGTLCLSGDDQNLYTVSWTQTGGKFSLQIDRWQSSGEAIWTKAELIISRHLEFSSVGAIGEEFIGQCLVARDETLWLGIANSGKPEDSHRLDTIAGKVLRIGGDFLSGTPPADGEASNDLGGEDRDAVDFIYAGGFRRPLALAEGPGGTIYVADQGGEVDRLLEVKEGLDAPWDGSVDSLTYNNLLTWPKAIGPSFMLYVPRDYQALSSWSEQSSRVGYAADGYLVVLGSTRPGVFAIPVSFSQGVTHAPRPLIEPGPEPLHITALALGTDGIFLVESKVRDGNGPSRILRLGAVGDRRSIDSATYSGAQLIDRYGCRSCHLLQGQGGEIGPPLDHILQDVASRLARGDYLDGLDFSAAKSSIADEEWSEIKANLASEGLAMGERVQWWIKAKLLDPRFDKPDSAMPNLEIPREHIDILASHLAELEGAFVQPVKDASLKAQMHWYMNHYWKVVVALAFGLGTLAGYLLGVRRVRKLMGRSSVAT